jgi:4'-phosphopantetheinyl transferase
MEIVWARPSAFGATAFRYLAETLDGEERARASRLVFEPDQRAFVAAHGLLRIALSRVAGGDPRDWRFVRDARGKPSAAGALAGGLSFSLSHARSMVACAWAPGGLLGIDVEEIPDREPDGVLLAACCSPEEIARLRALPAPDRSLEFTRLWTLKEAVAKARGAGLDDTWNLGLNAPGLDLNTVCPTSRHMIAYARSAVPSAPDPVTIREADDDWVTFAPMTRDA